MPDPDIGKLLLNKLASPNVSFLFGAGASKSVGYPLMSELSALARQNLPLDDPLQKTLSRLKGRTIEDQLAELYGQLRAPSLSRIPEKDLQACIDHMLDVIYAECAKPASIDAHRRFVSSVAQRTTEKRHVCIFTTNYDMLFEWASDAERIICVNGFYGIQERRFDQNQFDFRPARVVRQSRLFGGKGIAFHPCLSLYKLHGSVSWTSDGESVREIAVLPGSGRAPGQLMVFPTPQKTSETWKSPYSELIARMAELLGERQTALITLGFGFGDAHFMPIVEKCLSDNTFILVVLSKEMLPSFEPFKTHRNATIITESITVIEGKEYTVPSDLWSFPQFVELYATS